MCVDFLTHGKVCKTERDDVRLHIIDKNSWIRHYKDLWTDEEVNNTGEQDITIALPVVNSNMYLGDDITLGELTETLEQNNE